MLRKILPIVLFFSILFLLVPISANANVKIKSVSASLEASSSATLLEYNNDNRAEVLQQFLDQYDTELASESQTFVEEADKNNIDWKLLPAISGVESTFGQAVPFNCNNAWGYNIYGNTVRCFPSYKEAITIISYDIRHLYMNQWGATDVYSIGRLYAASPTWAERVAMYMQEIQDLDNKTSSPALPISL